MVPRAGPGGDGARQGRGWAARGVGWAMGLRTVGRLFGGSWGSPQESRLLAVFREALSL